MSGIHAGDSRRCGAVLVLGAVFDGILNPKFGVNVVSLHGLIGTIGAFAVGTTLSYFIARAFRAHHKYPQHTYLHALPAGLAIAAACVLVSCLTHF